MLSKKGRPTPIKHCRDCRAVTIHQTGSQLWVSCRFLNGWRSINSVCVLPEDKRK